MQSIDEEKVLVIPTSVFRTAGYFQGFSDDVERYQKAVLQSDALTYLSRKDAETDPSYKQLIPYVLVRWAEAERFSLFQYLRGTAQGEKRLHGRRSVGIGGHISEGDKESKNTADVYEAGMLRELREEVAISGQYARRLAGFINDDSNDVGKVHLGIVHIFDVTSPSVTPLEDGISQGEFWPISRIREVLTDFESWSQISVNAMFGTTGL